MARQPDDHRVTPSRTVKPRKSQCNADRPIIAVIDSMYSTEAGDMGTIEELILLLRKMPLTTIVSATESAAFLKRVQDHWGWHPSFNFRVMPIEREIFTGKDHGRKLVMSLTSVSWFGWQGEKRGRNNTVRNRYHLLLDPLTFSGSWLKDRSFSSYLKWAQDMRAFCIEQGWNLAPTQGAVARQALKDPRFYPEARRKVPRATNERIRKQLPGNHYQLGVTAGDGREYEADYLDQSRCHHQHAIQAKLPDSNSLYGYGHYRNPRPGVAFRTDPARIASFLDGFAGLIHGTIFWPLRYRKKATPFLPRCLRDYEPVHPPMMPRPVYFYSEDLPLFESLGVKVTSIIAAWGSKRYDTGLAKYAQFAIEELREEAPPWKKSLLLSPYGSLATTARKQTVAYHRSKGGTPEVLVTRHGTRLAVSMHTASKESEPSTNNVLHRALIEASNRTETLMYATFLESFGYKVLCIYVDGVIVEADCDLSTPAMFEPWRIDKHLTRLRFISDSQFVSAEIEKLPGISGQEFRKHVALGALGAATSDHLGSAEDQRLRKHRAWLRAS